MRVVTSQSAPKLLLICQHANRDFPDGRLGLLPRHLDMHIAYDIGALWVAETLAAEIPSTLVTAQYSRLYLDLNREPEDPSCIPAVSDTIPVPGNQNLSQAEKQKRIDSYHEPFHRELDRICRKYPAIPVLGIHSFTPALMATPEQKRIWDCGLMFVKHSRKNSRFVSAFLKELRQSPLHGRQLIVGENQPYSALEMGYTIHRCLRNRNSAGLDIEIRQNHIHSQKKAQDWGHYLAVLLERVLKKEPA